ncbi:synaptotagmin-7 [Lutzomyia longipalpis]|uniref:Putative ca2+-dependent phospholipid-binding protein synaptotagmin n=1 Tax=Lutzomyia longipalpis TaxID=7200 RepID=A0A1B0CD27_LUTLO|nr:synaptotagmin-7 [Lutzomyia longipalpis]XP_055690379.1 synaptotagmin-7 [Lutzomyia longipalpis]XP_055690380.1 synaptotagmin-7 [Lutzomyia longipalpis]XP_055690381.1 synaptotagmin-7 [Lutzomyia longipalpis]XP_055690382.1 synaptotagmin-7 [Lutzomyia longipalpis]
MVSVLVIGCLATLGAIVTVLLLFAGGYLWWRHKRSQLQFIEPNDDEENASEVVRLQQPVAATTDLVQETPPPQQNLSPLPTNNINRKLNGFLNIKSPLIGSSNPKTPGGTAEGGNVATVSNQAGDNRSISMIDMYIDNTDPIENVGQIHFSLEYDFQNSTLILKIIQGKELPAKDLSGTSDPYVRVTLLPDKKHRLETKIKRRTLNPRWNETFYFEGFPIQKLQSRVLHLHVFDYDRFSRDDSIGEVFMPLCQVDFTGKPAFWKALKPPAKDKCGELLASLCYQPSNSILTLSLIKARNLKAKDINGKSDPYVKVWLQFGEKRVDKRKTPIFKCTLNPIFNEAFSFSVPWEKIRECSLDIMVMDFDNIGRNELIGRILLAGKNGSGASETKHWQDMISKPRQTIVQWHRLKPE